MIIGLAGVTSTGKTTLSLAIQEEFEKRVYVQQKISRFDIYSHLGHVREWSQDLHKLPNENRAEFDWGRCQLQMKVERGLYSGPIRNVIIDGCALVKAAYMIFLSGQYVDSEVLDRRVGDVLEHCNMCYSAIFYLPVTRLPFKEADHRYFKSQFLREGQDAVLRRLLTKYIDHNIKVCTLDDLDSNLAFDELRKLGV